MSLPPRDNFRRKILNFLVDSFSVYAPFCIPVARRTVRLRSDQSSTVTMERTREAFFITADLRFRRG